MLFPYRANYTKPPVAGEIWCIRPRIEKKLIRSATVRSAKSQFPQPRNDDRLTLGIGQRAEQREGVSVKGIDLPVLNIADQQRIAELAKMAWRKSNRPRIDQGTLARSVGGEMMRCQ